jgi:putative two-component system hydrogenase maturation factor HypX/HoxX
VSSAAGLRCGLADRVIEGGPPDYRAQVADLAEQLAGSPHYAARLAAKARELIAAEKEFPLAAYRHQELAIMSRNFFDPQEPYAQLRRAFVYKDRPTQTPPHLSGHRILLGSATQSAR